MSTSFIFRKRIFLVEEIGTVRLRNLRRYGYEAATIFFTHFSFLRTVNDWLNVIQMLWDDFLHLHRFLTAKDLIAVSRDSNLFLDSTTFKI